MLTAIISFLGSAFFRAAFERIASFFEAKQEFEREEKLMRLQLVLDKARHEMQLETTRIAMTAKEQMEWMKALAAAHVADSAPTGVPWVDAWRKSIRPGGATVLFALYAATKGVAMFDSGTVAMDEFDKALLGSIMGFYYMDRSLAKSKRPNA